MIELSGINKSFRKNNGEQLNVLTEADLSVDAGNFAVVRGASGCGKSTLLLIAGSLLEPDRGSVEVADINFTSMPREKRAVARAGNIGFVFQRFHLLPYLTVEENIMAASVAKPEKNDSLKKRALELMRQFGLENRSGQLPGSLSVGEMQRTALARALCNRPKVILADEPTGNLDPENADIVLRSLSDFADNGGTVLMVTHSQADPRGTTHSWLLENAGLCPIC